MRPNEHYDIPKDNNENVAENKDVQQGFYFSIAFHKKH